MAKTFLPGRSNPFKMVTIGRFRWVIVTSANEHQIFAPVGLVFNGLCTQLADLREQTDLSQALGWALLSSYFVELLKKTWGCL